MFTALWRQTSPRLRTEWKDDVQRNVCFIYSWFWNWWFSLPQVSAWSYLLSRICLSCCYHVYTLMTTRKVYQLSDWWNTSQPASIKYKKNALITTKLVRISTNRKQRFGNWICFRLQARGGHLLYRKTKSLPFHRRCQNKRRSTTGNKGTISTWPQEESMGCGLLGCYAVWPHGVTSQKTAFFIVTSHILHKL
jgi:hypothetical protein